MTDRPARPRSRGVWIAVVWGLVCALVVVAALTLRDPGPESGADRARPVLTKPREAAGFTLVRSEAAQRFSRSAEQELAAQAPGGDALVGTYERDDETVVYVGFSFPAGTDQGRALDASPDDALEDYLESAGVTDTKTHDAGPLGGALRCGEVAAGDETHVTCAWADRGTLGSLRFVRGPLTDGPTGRAAEVTVDFRTAAEPTS